MGKLEKYYGDFTAIELQVTLSHNDESPQYRYMFIKASNQGKLLREWVKTTKIIPVEYGSLKGSITKTLLELAASKMMITRLENINTSYKVLRTKGCEYKVFVDVINNAIRIKRGPIVSFFRNFLGIHYINYKFNYLIKPYKMLNADFMNPEYFYYPPILPIHVKTLRDTPKKNHQAALLKLMKVNLPMSK